MVNNQPDFSQPKRQSSVAIGIILIKFIRMTVKAFWPILLSFFIGRKTGGSNFEEIIGYIVLGFAAFNLGGSVLTYFRFYFHIEANAVVIDKGVLKRTKTNIPFERIQTINFKQNILHQLFNVVSVEIDTAGAKKSEISIDALNKEEAVALRGFILAEKEQTPDSNSVSETKPDTEEQILHLNPLDLLKIGISQNHLKSMALIFAFVFTTINELTENINSFIQNQFDQYENYMVDNALFVFVFSIIVVLIISFLFSLINAVLKYYELRLSIHQKGLKLIRGLLNREEITINRNKVQVISWSDNPIRKIFSMFTLKVAQASSTESNTKLNIAIPGCYQQQVDKIISTVFSKEQYFFDTTHKVSKHIKTRLFLFFGIIPTIIGLTSYLYTGYCLVYFIAILPISWGIISLYYSKRTYELNHEFFKNNGGLFGKSHELIQTHKIQAIKIKQSLYQKRKRLATLSIHTAAGNLTLPFIELDKAHVLENFILYRIETDKREWM